MRGNVGGDTMSQMLAANEAFPMVASSDSQAHLPPCMGDLPKSKWAFVPYFCCNKALQTQWYKTPQICSLIVRKSEVQGE